MSPRGYHNDGGILLDQVSFLDDESKEKRWGPQGKGQFVHDRARI
eukprot:CAMPEP_0185267850 /NCGR_PEP_ID=MMETSP1359-20130426/35427_1 /TAXON_ID=552665 /ORGANISM="Bigelowiella longifila, Strain CCMP242" /LENGTH=44 /DNA_ID= /DNA_START= /DNA_END= /DNA_ORIENTATION=